jgi:hypothetical protein
MTQHDFERSVLATIMFGDLMTELESKNIECVELYEEWFDLHFHKVVVKTINAMRAKDVPTTYEMVLHYLDKNGLLDENRFIDIGTTTPLSYRSFIHYYNELKHNKRKMAAMV